MAVADPPKAEAEVMNRKVRRSPSLAGKVIDEKPSDGWSGKPQLSEAEKTM